MLPGSATHFAGHRALPCLYHCRRGLSRVPASASATAAEEPPEQLFSWLNNTGSKIHGVQLVPGGPRVGYGLLASQDTAPGSPLIELDRRCLLTYGPGTDKRVLQLIERVPADLWGARLALQVLAERVAGPQGHFNAYISNLPMGVAGLPMFYGPQAVKALQYPPLSEQVRKRCSWLLQFSSTVLAKLPGTPQDPYGGQIVDANALAWGLAMVTSRAFRPQGPEQTAAMLPLVDMCNHSFNPNCEVKPHGSYLALVAKRRILAGEQLEISYGTLSNDFLLLDYGFTVAGNPHDRVSLRFGFELLQAAQLEVRQAATLNAAGLEDLPGWQAQRLGQLLQQAGPEITLGREPPADAALVAAARVLAAAEEGSLQGRSLPDLGLLDKPLTKDTEVRALRTLAGAFLVAINRFETSLAEDEAQLAEGVRAAASSGMTPDMYLAINFRAEKKRALQDGLRSVTTTLKALMDLKDPNPMKNMR